MNNLDQLPSTLAPAVVVENIRVELEKRLVSLIKNLAGIPRSAQVSIEHPLLDQVVRAVEEQNGLRLAELRM